MTSNRQAAIDMLQSAIALLNSKPQDRDQPCDMCEMYRDGFCKHWDREVPESARAAGCDQWIDLIPF